MDDMNFTVTKYKYQMQDYVAVVKGFGSRESEWPSQVEIDQQKQPVGVHETKKRMKSAVAKPHFKANDCAPPAGYCRSRRRTQ